MNITPVELIIESHLKKEFSEPQYRPELLLAIQINSAIIHPNLQNAIARMRKEKNRVAHITADTLEAGGDDNYEILHGEYIIVKQRKLTFNLTPFGPITIFSRQQISKPYSSLDNMADWQIEDALALAKHEHRHHEQLSASNKGNLHANLLLIASATPAKTYTINDTITEPKSGKQAHYYVRSESYDAQKFATHFIEGLETIARLAKGQ